MATILIIILIVWCIGLTFSLYLLWNLVLCILGYFPREDREIIVKVAKDSAVESIIPKWLKDMAEAEQERGNTLLAPASNTSKSLPGLDTSALLEIWVHMYSLEQKTCSSSL